MAIPADPIHQVSGPATAWTPGRDTRPAMARFHEVTVLMPA